MTRIEGIHLLKEEVTAIIATCMKVPQEKFTTRKNTIWSPAEQIRHLQLSIRPLKPAYMIPEFMLHLLFGKPGRPPYSFDQLQEQYQLALNAGGKASAPYIPKSLTTASTPQALLQEFQIDHEQLAQRISRRSESSLDNCLLPHPLLGKITLREMMYFTIFHIRHHHQNIQINYLSI